MIVLLQHLFLNKANDTNSPILFFPSYCLFISNCLPLKHTLTVNSTIMSKAQDAKKEKKKEPTKSIKEKRAEKQAKKKD